ncbi:hypothetical protein, partial [Marinobacter halodurans]|uniref:hypothetical protein n=1 Tax=Marinobacter halodurans TaxID=2528979 RepID=UPI001A9555C5
NANSRGATKGASLACIGYELKGWGTCLALQPNYSEITYYLEPIVNSINFLKFPKRSQITLVIIDNV